MFPEFYCWSWVCGCQKCGYYYVSSYITNSLDSWKIIHFKACSLSTHLLNLILARWNKTCCGMLWWDILDISWWARLRSQFILLTLTCILQFCSILLLSKYQIKTSLRPEISRVFICGIGIHTHTLFQLAGQVSCYCMLEADYLWGGEDLRFMLNKLI